MKTRVSFIGVTSENAFITWMRIVAGSVAAVTGVTAFWTHPHDFLTGIAQISTALFLLFMKFRQPNESLQEYIVKPRAVITLASVLIMTACTFVWLARHFR